MKHVAALLFLALSAGPAIAALAPEYYEEARANAASVVVIDIERVRTPPLWRATGDCVVEGRVAAVERGALHAVGDAISVRVPCRRPNADIPAGGVQWEEMGALKRSERGRAWLTPDGALALYQYEIVN